MAYEQKIGLSRRLTQSLVITPQLKHAIKILQLSRADLETLVQEEVEQNPTLEELSDGQEDREVAHFKDSLVPKFAELVYNGFWFAPEMDLLRSMVETTQASVTGTVRLKLFKGGITISGRKSPFSLYNAEQSSFETRMSIDPSDSGGFINVNGLRLSTWSAVWPRL